MKVALIVIYNHQYNKNIEVIESIYKSRFSHIYHLVPFYRGNIPNVIPVYENSYYFQGYMAQGLKSYFNETYQHYFFIADDLVLNPAINENNYHEHLKLTGEACFLPGFISLHTLWHYWARCKEAWQYTLDVRGVEAKNQVPSYDNALRKFNDFGLEVKPLHFAAIWGNQKPVLVLKDASLPQICRRVTRYFHRFMIYAIKKTFRKRRGYSLSYPLVGSYSDICVVSAETMREFCHYCGVFAATGLFVELGLPTAMVLSAKKIITEKDLSLHGKALWSNDERSKELDRYNNKLSSLLDNFPAGYIYLHPVKLSRWDTN